MTVRDKPTLKTYFVDGRPPREPNYVDLIDTMAIVTEVSLGALTMYTPSSYLTHNSWLLNTSHAAGVYTITRAMFGWPATARMLYMRLAGRGVSASGYAGCSNSSTLFAFPIQVAYDNVITNSIYGNVLLTATGGDFYVRIGTSTAYIQLEIWGYYL